VTTGSTRKCFRGNSTIYGQLRKTVAPEAFDFARDAANPAIRKLYGLDPQHRYEALARASSRRTRRALHSRAISRRAGRTRRLWDTHTPTQVRGALPKLALACDQPLAGLITDLKQRGLLDQTLVVWGGEMGRGGPGHMNHNGSAFTWWMAGGGVRSGFAYGATDEQGFTAVENPVHVRDLHATILWMCGLDYSVCAPESTSRFGIAGLSAAQICRFASENRTDWTGLMLSAADLVDVSRAGG
jgi:arylsulfatase A-like enzyme